MRSAKHRRIAYALLEPIGQRRHLLARRRPAQKITRKAVPLDMRALQGLGMGKNASPLALDIYQWLTHRFSYLKERVTVPWEALQPQFGGDYGRLRDFQTKFLEHLKLVLKFYSQANVEPTPRGLLLSPSKTHVPMRLIRGTKFYGY